MTLDGEPAGNRSQIDHHRDRLDSTPFPGLDIDEERIVSSTGALVSPACRDLVVIGGGYIGLELGSVWRRLGAKVTVIEFLDRILPGMDRELGPALQRVLTRSGFRFKLATKVVSGRAGNDGVTLTWSPSLAARRNRSPPMWFSSRSAAAPSPTGSASTRSGSSGTPAADQGRCRYATNVAGIYAIGDVITGPMLAHKAEEEGVALVERLAGQRSM